MSFTKDLGIYSVNQYAKREEANWEDQTKIIPGIRPRVAPAIISRGGIGNGNGGITIHKKINPKIISGAQTPKDFICGSSCPTLLPTKNWRVTITE